MTYRPDQLRQFGVAHFKVSLRKKLVTDQKVRLAGQVRLHSSRSF